MLSAGRRQSARSGGWTLPVIAGAIAAAAVITDLPPLVRWSVAIVAGGGTAGVVQTAMSMVRLKSTTFTAGFGNFLVSTFELAASLVASFIAIVAPIIALIMVTGILAVFFLLFRSRLIPRRQMS